MAINAEIPLQVQVPDIGGGILQFAQMKQAREDRQRQNKLLDIQTKQAEAQQKEFEQGSGARLAEKFSERELANLKSLSIGASALKPYMDAGDYEGARRVAQTRRDALEAARLQGADITTTETDEFLRALDANPGQAKQMIDQTLQLGTKLGFLKNPESKLLTPAELAQQKELRAAGKTDVNIDTKGAGKEAEKIAEQRVTFFSQLQEKGLQAEEQNVGLSQVENIDVKTGFGEEAKGQLARVFNSLGVNGNSLTGVDPANIQAMNAVTGKLVLDVMAAQKGPQTDADRAGIAKTLPTIQNEALANKFTINSLKAINFRKMEMRDFYEKFLDDNQTLKGADREWASFKQKTPLLSDNIKDPETGLPMFFHEFKQKATERNPNASPEQIVNAWRELAK